MLRTTRLLLFLLIFACEDNDLKLAPVEMAGLHCGKNVAEMQWLQDLIKLGETNMAKRGDIYVGSYDGQVIFVHQPVILSCLACIIYDCQGNKLDPSAMDLQKVVLNMESKNRIYSASF
jgi:hypothetical protein